MYVSSSLVHYHHIAAARLLRPLVTNMSLQSFDPENPSIGADPYTVFSYNTILGSLNSLKRAPQSTHDVVNTHMSKPAVNKRTGWDHQVQVR